MTTDLPRYETAGTDDSEVSEGASDSPLNEYTDPADEGVQTTGQGMRGVIEDQAADIAGLKQQLEEQTDANRAITMSGAYSEIGLNPDVGVGKAIATLYDGEADGLAEYARTEFQHEPSTPVHPQAAQIALGYHQLDQVGNVARSMRQTTRADRLATAQATGDYETEGAIMAAQMVELMDRAEGRSV